MLRGIRNPQAAQCFHGHRHYAERFARLLEFPARDGDHAIRFQMLEIFAECLHGIKIVFA